MPASSTQSIAGNVSLQLATAPAPVAPDGTVSAAVTGLLVIFRDPDPSTPGIGLKAGGTVKITLTDDFKFVNYSMPVLSTDSVVGCKPPSITVCSTAALVQRWPQSLVLPFPDVKLYALTNTFTLTAIKDWMPAGVTAPGPKVVHLMVDILVRHQACIAPNSQANGKPPPPFVNTLYQRIKAGETSLKMKFYLWDKGGNAMTGPNFVMSDSLDGQIVSAENEVVGTTTIDSPDGSTAHKLVTDGRPGQAVQSLFNRLRNRCPHCTVANGFSGSRGVQDNVRPKGRQFADPYYSNSIALSGIEVELPSLH